ncbi:MAG: adenosylcobalamin-dependent ribonucleoside-diphosphate reductase [Bacteroidales bacterium]|jgi:ribonucleoside-diphosphate reductase alpha chain|nr:adenosylcobalamin-dependent ribonucleoside-diphosphate reductase [Bacteroidales bacterium]MCK9499085.1 adenosylcobalamin-dependent ribonucleoside-diphosphate reductase [Bacteroidales bacterium]MDY0315762.1 adenosylcobalamin-dependent ribonucleoside-diphosphate reductase [Bacteroidales bacterium]
MNLEKKQMEQDFKADLKRKVFSDSEALLASQEYFKGDELAARVWINKYALKDSDGNLYELTPDDMHRRLVKEIYRIESKYENPLSEEILYELFKDFKYIIPQGGPMSGIGNNMQIVSLSNCFVIGHDRPTDSYGGILKTDQEQVQLMKRRGGVGHDLSHLRPKGSPVKNSALTSTGIVPFMERYSNTTREVAQDGRRGALMLSVSVKHPDSEDFIDAKLTQGKVTAANVSVKITDEFMNALINKDKFIQQYPIDDRAPKYIKEVDPQKIWKKIIHNAWKSAEPGILFWDTIIRESVADCYADIGYKTVSTNPCGEIPLCPYDSCRLLAINLYSYVDNPFTKEAKFNFDKFKLHVGYAQKIMDDIIDLELEKIDQILSKINSDPEDLEVKRIERKLWENIRRKAEEGRRTGVGITAEGDMLAALGLIYGTDTANDFATEVHKTLAIEAYRSSVNMAKERSPFIIYDSQREKNNPFIERLRKADPEMLREMEIYGRRNISLLTIAPTGTTSLMTQTTSGIEPVFRPFYTRRRKVNPNDPEIRVDFVDEQGDKWEEYKVFHHKFLVWLQANKYDVNAVKKMSNDEINELVKKSPYHKATAEDVDYLNKVKMQGSIQKWVDHSISVTINMPENVSEEVVEECYLEAWKSGCKGITVYREGSRAGVLISDDKNDKQAKQILELKRPKVLEADIVRFRNDDEEWIAFVGLLNRMPYEIFTGRVEEDTLNIPKTIENGRIIKESEEDGNNRYDFQYTNRYGYATTFQGLSHQFDKTFWNYAKLISGVLRHGMAIDKAVELVSSLEFDNDSINTWKRGVERALRKYIPNGTKASKKGDICPGCQQEDTQIYQDGCVICTDCGYSKCS